MAATYEELMLKARELAAAGKTEEAKRVAQIAVQRRDGATPQAQTKTPQTGLLEQGMSGVNEGIASAVGTPVDLVTGVINGMVQRPLFDSSVQPLPDGGFDFKLTPQGMSPGIDAPVGGSQTMLNVLDPVISDVAPQTGGQRFARRVGQEIGYGTVAAPLAMATPAVRGTLDGPKAIAQYLAANTASDAGAGIGGATAREINPDSDMLDMVMSMGGGIGTATGISAATKTRPPAPTLDDIETRKNAAYGVVENSGVMLTPEGRNALAQSVGSEIASNRASDPALYPKAHHALTEISSRPQQLWSVDDWRKWIGNKVAGDPSEARVGVAMKNAIDEFLDNADQTQMRDGNIPASEAVAALREGRRNAAIEFKARDVLEAQRAGESRASTAGTGGNVLNTQSQNIRKLYDTAMDLRKNGKPTGFTPDELAQMERIIFPDFVEQNLRRVGRLSPTSGALMTGFGAAATGGGVTAAALSGNPAALVAAAPSAIGMIAQGLAERAKKKNIAELADIILRGGTKVVPKPNDAAKAAIAAQLLSSTDAGPR